MRVHVQDGAEFVAAAARLRHSMPDHSGYYDLVFIDTFNGNDDLPDSLFGPGTSVCDLWNNLWCNLKRMSSSGLHVESGIESLCSLNSICVWALTLAFLGELACSFRMSCIRWDGSQSLHGISLVACHDNMQEVICSWLSG